MFGNLLTYRNPYGGQRSKLDLQEFLELAKGAAILAAAMAGGTWLYNRIAAQVAAARAARSGGPRATDADPMIIVNG